VIVVVEVESAFPSTPVLDNFNRSNGPIGSQWLDEMSDLAIDANQMILAGNNASTTWGGAVFGPDQEVYVTFDAVSEIGPEQNLMLKIQGDQWHAGHIEVRYDATVPRIAVATYSPMQGWVGRGSLDDVTLAPGDQFGARVFSNGIVHIFVNGENIGSVSVEAWPYHSQGGRIGLTLSGAVGARMDNFGGGNYLANNPPIAMIMSPGDDSFYAEGDTIQLVGQGSDYETASNELTSEWRVDVHHNNHVHPGAPMPGPNASFVGHNHDDGTGVHLEAIYSVTDGGGLVASTRIHIHPEVDLQPTAATVSPEIPTAGGNAEYRFWIRNHGRMPSRMSRWALSAGSYVLATGDTVVPARDSVQIAIQIPTLMPAGSYTLRVRADSLSVVTETAEINNASNQNFTVAPNGNVGVGDGVPASLSLAGPFPNPSRGRVGLDLGLPQRSAVRFAIYDIQGREIWRAAEKEHGAGWWRLEWNGRDQRQQPVRPGLYMARVEVGRNKLVKSVVVIR
jgi:hypothetical protein